MNKTEGKTSKSRGIGKDKKEEKDEYLFIAREEHSFSIFLLFF